MDRKSETGAAAVEAACPLCGGAGRPLFSARDLLHGLDGDFGVSVCGQCGFAFTSPRPPLEKLGDYYPADYSPHAPRAASKGEIKTRLRRGVLQEYYNYPGGRGGIRKMFLRPAYLRFRANTKNVFYVPWRGAGRILDIGCGSGRWLSRLRDAGWQTAGLDISPQAARTAAAAYGIEVKVGSYPHEHFPAASFDAVTLWNSLEHMADPVGVLASAHKVLDARGRLYLSVPNFASFGSRRFREHWFPLDLPRHLNHFTPHTLSAALGNSGFDLEWIRPLRRTSSLLKSARFAIEAGDRRLVTKLLATRAGAGIASRFTAGADNCELIAACARKRE